MKISIVLMAAMVLSGPATAQSAPVNGQTLYMDNCASCHGRNLEGQADWMQRLPNGRLPAPPHDETGHTWHHADDVLLEIVQDGLAAISPGYQTDMPAFAGVLTEAEILDILDFIKQSWPERERQSQSSR